MNRKEFFKTSLAGAAAFAVASTGLSACASPAAAARGGRKGVKLNLSFQERIAPGDTLAQKLDYMEKLGIAGLEPGGRGLAGRVRELQDALRGRDIRISAICAGFDGFILAEDSAVKAKFDTTMREIVRAAGELGSTGVIMVPAFNGQKPCRPHNQQTRDFLCNELHKLGEYAKSCGTTVILEPLNRKEAFYLRQVGDAAAIARDADSDGVRVMGDFWHMQEEVSDYGAFLSAGKYLRYVHIASRGTRNMPGEDGGKDWYVDGFRGLKELGYEHFVSFECGTRGDRAVTVPRAVSLLRAQWEEA